MGDKGLIKVYSSHVLSMSHPPFLTTHRAHTVARKGGFKT